MNKVALALNVIRNFGPRIVRLRARVYLDKVLGTTWRHFSPCDWEKIRLEDILLPGTPTETSEYADFKRRQSIQSFFPLGQASLLPPWLLEGTGERQPALAERLRLIAENRSIYCFHIPSRRRLDGRDHSHIECNGFRKCSPSWRYFG